MSEAKVRTKALEDIVAILRGAGRIRAAEIVRERFDVESETQSVEPPGDNELMDKYTIFMAGRKFEVSAPLADTLIENADQIVRQRDKAVIKDRFSEFPDKKVDLSKVVPAVPVEEKRRELLEAAQQVGSDLGFPPLAKVPNWLREAGFRLQEKGWLRKEGRDPREQKAQFRHDMERDLQGEAIGDTPTWITLMSKRLVETGWSLEKK